jgi:hypothetical protein
MTNAQSKPISYNEARKNVAELYQKIWPPELLVMVKPYRKKDKKDEDEDEEDKKTRAAKFHCPIRHSPDHPWTNESRDSYLSLIQEQFALGTSTLLQQNWRLLSGHPQEFQGRTLAQMGQWLHTVDLARQAYYDHQSSLVQTGNTNTTSRASEAGHLATIPGLNLWPVQLPKLHTIVAAVHCRAPHCFLHSEVLPPP